jgi:hypothetical protein
MHVILVLFGNHLFFSGKPELEQQFDQVRNVILKQNV